jgi:Icc-related predicted phosphoesterase
MRIAVTTDIHFHLPWFDQIVRLSRMLEERAPDMLVIAGDLGEPIEMFNQCLEVFKPVAENLAALAGNHDVWHREGGLTSHELWETALEKAARDQGYFWLDRENIILGELGICGGIGWYDYSARHPKVKLDPDEYERLKPLISNDANYIDWGWTDRQFATIAGNELVTRMEALHDQASVMDILVITHVPLFEGCVRYLDGVEEVVANAYYGNLTLGARLVNFPKLRMALAGHIHRERYVVVDRGGLPPLPVYTNPSDYGTPAALLVDTDTWQVDILRTGGSQ